ncbi:cyclase family protein [Halobacteriovorax sp.]|uniref:cyclase family protein n=1 Tax=Halobacteriovorax sp. TaxID=2020862 RepID=UPI003AF29F78
MPYIISPSIKLNSKGEWLEGVAYEKENLYKIEEGKLPPVHYDAHILRPHSLTHIETPKHTQKEGKSTDFFFKNNPNHFFGPCIVIKFKNEGWKELGDGLKQKVIQEEEIREKLKGHKRISKVLISVENVQENEFGFHEPKHVLTLSHEAARYLTSFESFNLFGTSWKSSDFMPGSSERPIHNEIFKNALILENINLNEVPEGEYFINCFPLNMEDSSESPVTAVLFDKNDLSSFIN